MGMRWSLVHRLDPRGLVSVQQGHPDEEERRDDDAREEESNRDAHPAEAAQDERKNCLREEDKSSESQKRAEGVEEVGPRKLPSPGECGERPQILADENRNDETERGEPRDSRQDEREHEERDRRNDEPAR